MELELRLLRHGHQLAVALLVVAVGRGGGLHGAPPPVARGPNDSEGEGRGVAVVVRP